MSNLWIRLSARERYLAAATLTVTLATIGWFITTRAFGEIRELDESIDAAQQELINYEQQLLRSTPVDDAFARIASQHSSEWTAEEIRDGLHREILRLALRVPPESDEDEDAAPAKGYRLLEIPSLPDGALSDQGSGYREYTLEFRSQPGSVSSEVATFLSRLIDSPQALRVDTFQINREPEKNSVDAYFKVTRTVVDGVKSEPELEMVATLTNPSFELAPESASSGILGWLGQQSSLVVGPEFASDGVLALQVTALAAAANVYQVVEMLPGQIYQVQANIASSGPGEMKIGVLDTASETIRPLDVGQALVGDGGMYRYTVRFTTPPLDDALKICAPLIVLNDKDTVAHVDNVTLDLLGIEQ